MTNLQRYKEDIIADLQRGTGLEVAIYKHTSGILYDEDNEETFRAELIRWLAEEYYQPLSETLSAVKLDI